MGELAWRLCAERAAAARRPSAAYAPQKCILGQLQQRAEALADVNIHAVARQRREAVQRQPQERRERFSWRLMGHRKLHAAKLAPTPSARVYNGVAAA